MLETISQAMGGAAVLGPVGGLVGLLGGLVQRGMALYETKKNLERELELARINSAHELAMADKRMAEITLEAEKATQLAEVNRQKETDIATLNAIGKAMEMDKATYAIGDNAGNPWMIAVDVVRGLTRPVAFWILLWAVLFYTGWIWHVLPSDVVRQPDFLAKTFYRLIEALIFMFCAAGSFWYVTRAPQQPGGKASA